MCSSAPHENINSSCQGIKSKSDSITAVSADKMFEWKIEVWIWGMVISF